MDFQEMRGQILKEMSDRNEKVLKEFFYKINYKGIVGYDNKLVGRVFVVYTDKPGVLIGKGGENVAILKDILREEFGYEYQVEFHEIRGKMVVIV